MKKNVIISESNEIIVKKNYYVNIFLMNLIIIFSINYKLLLLHKNIEN